MFVKHRFKITVIILTVIFILLMRTMAATVSTAASNVPSLFVNDIAYPDHAAHPLYTDNGVHYVPHMLFGFMRGVTIMSNDGMRNDFIIRYGDKWIAFNISARSAYDASQNLLSGVRAILTGRGRNIIYVPVQAVANIIGLQVEVSDAHGSLSLRIKDSSATRSFRDMLQDYIITVPPVTVPPVITPFPNTAPPIIPTTTPVTNTIPSTPAETTDHPFTTLPIPTPAPNTNITTIPSTTTETATEPATVPTTAENTQNIDNYLMFYSGEQQDNTDNLGQILNYLGANSIRALFFMSGEEITGNPDKLRRIFASGHDVGIKIDKTDFDDLTDEVNTANAYIYSLVKQKTRFYIITAEFDNVEYMKDRISELSRAGYYQCRHNIILEPEHFKNIDSAVDFLKRNQVNLFAFDLNNPENIYDYLKLMADASDIKFYINFSHINNANVSRLR